MSGLAGALKQAGRAVILMSLVAAGTILLMRFAPGYFTDAREMDAKYATGARAELGADHARSVGAVAAEAVRGWMHADLGTSRQYEVPVTTLLGPRLRVTAWLLVRGIFFGWMIAICAALPLSALRRGAAVLSVPFTLLLAVPTGAMATLCLLSDFGGPVLVLTLLLAARDFKFLHRVLTVAWRAPHLLQGRAQGLRADQLVRGHILPDVLPQMRALATLSVLTALSAVVPVEVIFNVPGVGQLAWTAAMNRDLPVLLSVTLLMAAAVVCAGILSHMREMEVA